MRGTFQGVLSNIPGLAGYLAGQANDQSMQSGQLQQIGVLSQLAQRAQATQREQQFRSELGALGPNATQEQLAQVAAKFAPARDVLTSQQGSLDRKNALQIAQEARAAQMEQARTLQQERIQAQMETARQRAEDQKLSRAEQNEARAQMMRLAASLRQPQQRTPVAVVGPDGKPVYVSPEDAVGKMPFNAGDKATKAGEKLMTGKESVSSLVATLRDQYNQLNERGGITDPSKDVLSNAMAGVSSSPVGQAIGRGLGTVNQSTRNQIAQQRPLLLQAIKEATGMSAKQMDSNAELKLYLSAATDPTLDIRANLAALDKIDELYGLGKGEKDKPKGDNGLEGAVKAAGWAYEPNAYEYRVVDGKVQRKRKK